ncbi:MAG: glycosyltransferase family 39 protein [Chloroflexota bacterium]
MTRNKLYPKLAFIGLILITLLIYYPPFDWAFVGDDYVQFDYIKQAMANHWAYFALLNPYEIGWYYRPLQLIWFGLLEMVFHFQPEGYYWVALLFHALTVALVYRVARQLKMGWITAVLTATLFAIHSHWVDVVTWLSAIAIIQAALFSLLAVSAWLGYLQRPSTRQLFLTLLFTLLTFLSHEEAVLLPPVLFLLLLGKRLEIGDWRLEIASNLQSPISKKELLIFVGLALFTAAYIAIMFTRPNLTVDISSRGSTDWLAYFTWPEFAEFVIVTVYRFTFIPSLLNLSGTAASSFVIVVLALVGVWFWRGSWVVRLGLAWLLLHLSFIYLALWTQLPLLYAGRHIYQGGLGLVLAIGATFEMFLAFNFSPQRAQRARRPSQKAQQTRQSQRLVLGMLVLGVTAVSLHHINRTRLSQQQWLDDVLEEAEAREQLADLFPTISPDNHFFALRFPIAPQFTRTVVQLWYDTPLERPGGDLPQLRTADPVTRAFVVLDYDKGQVYNLMPELQAHDETIFLWAQPTQQVWLDEFDTEIVNPNPEAQLPIVTAENGRFLSLKLIPANGRWLSNKVQLEIPPNSVLETAVLPQPGVRYRLRLLTSSGQEQILFEYTGEEEVLQWQPVSVPLAAYANSSVTLRFEVMGEDLPEGSGAFWANPRLGIDLSNG